MFLAATVAQAQEASTPTQPRINIQGKVFGGARQSNVTGESNVTIHGGEDESEMIAITGVFGGNDIAGTINGRSNVKTDGGNQLFVAQLFGGGNGDYEYEVVKSTDADAGEEGVNVGKLRVTQPVWSETLQRFVQQSMGYYVTDRPSNPVLNNASIDIGAGTFGYVYGGGNAATVTGSAVIKINIPDDNVPLNISQNNTVGDSDDLFSDLQLQTMGINTEFFDQKGKYHIARLFGGNNKAEMSIRPTWDLEKGKIENLYSGGNEGAMTSEEGLLLEIMDDSHITVENLFGGCRKADVHPRGSSGGEVDDNKVQLSDKDPVTGLPKYGFPAGLAARVLVRGGNIRNIYGGNDVKGRVYGGNAIGVYTSISGSIYGGGNGSYPYTDNPALEFSPKWGDFYYSVPAGKTSAQALNETRPNAEQVSIRVVGNAVGTGDSRVITPTVIGGAIYCGGNSATLKTTRTSPRVELKIGSHVIADSVFLGNNGKEMVQVDIKNENNVVVGDGVLKIMASTDKTGNGTKFNSMDLTDPETFSDYMDGCAMDLQVAVKFDGDDEKDPATYESYSSYFGSFFCGGNVGSMTKSDSSTISFNKPVIIYKKVVGGCNDAYVEATNYNAAYQGGIIGSPSERPLTLASDPRYLDNDGHIQNRLILNFNGLKIQPLRMPIPGVDDEATDISGGKGIPLVWNTIKLGEREDGKPVPIAWNAIWGDYDALHSTMNRRFNEGNIYGGCCTSGVVNGNVVINIEETVVDRLGDHGVFDEVLTDDKTGEDKLYGNNYEITKPVSGVILGQQGMDVLGSALNIFGGGKGKDTEIWGSTTINLKRGYVFQIFGGSEEGAIGKRKIQEETDEGKTIYTRVKDKYGRYVYDYNPKYSTKVNLKGSNLHPGVPKSQDMGEDIAEAEFLYGGGFAGPIAGNTRINLDNGRIFNSFAGSCNADIQGHTETYIGANGFPYVRDYVYGGNDLGGEILGEKKDESKVDCDFSSRIPTGRSGMVYNNNATEVLTASAYIEYIQGRAEKIFGGCYGVYDYADPLYNDYFYARGKSGTTPENMGQARSGYSKPLMGNAFINFRPKLNSSTLNTVGQIYGAGQGKLGEKEGNKLQKSSYIFIDVPQTLDNFRGTEVFGAGECGGVGMHVNLKGANPADASDDIHLDKASAIIDLVSGKLKAVYGGSFMEGITRRTVVNVPENSTFHANSIFGGAYGLVDRVTRIKKDDKGQDVIDEETGEPVEEIVSETPRIDVACDVYEAIVNYQSEDAIVEKAIYGGNNDCRRTFYGKVNIDAPVYNGETSADGTVKYTATVYGAGYGVNTWSQYTEVNLNEEAEVDQVYGGGENGQVLNLETVNQWKTNLDNDNNVTYKLNTALEGYTNHDYGFGDADHPTPVTVARLNEVDATTPKYYNTNVHIRRGATVDRYAYGGGLGSDDISHSGNVYGTTYIDLLGGKVTRDLYAAGTTGSVKDSLRVGNTTNNFIATSTAYIEGGSARNVYGGGWKGTVGHHDAIRVTPVGGTAYTDTLGAPYYYTAADIAAEQEGDKPAIHKVGDLKDVPGETYVYIGIQDENLAAVPVGDPHYHYYNGVPAVERNAYGGGEGGAVWGTTHVIMNNGYVGYRYNKTSGLYDEKIEDETYRDKDGHFQANTNLDDAGCIFGGGYIDNSSVDFANVKMYGGHVRNALFGGGEIAAVGRGRIQETKETVNGQEKAVRTLQGIYRPGKTHVELFDGHVHRNVFGGGRGYNNLGDGGHLFSDGYVFGQTEVHIHGGEIGTEEELANENGNVFGGGDIGYVYSAYEYKHENGNMLPRKGVKSGSREADIETDPYQGYYYEHVWENDTDENEYFINHSGERALTEDCKVLVEPYCKVKSGKSLSCDVHYAKGEILSENDLEFLIANISTENTTALAGINQTTGEVTATNGITFNRSFAAGDYVPTSALNTLGNKTDGKWQYLEANTNDDGIVIHNAVFAGGNTSTKGADKENAYANTTSVYGNATASIHDVYHRDLITIGTGHIGGLYGDGNLTKVDGYRGLNITNYGTDYYYFFEEQNQKEMPYEAYAALLEREQAYYELRYKCVQNCQDDEKTWYYAKSTEHPNPSTLTADDIKTLFKNNTQGVLNSDGTINSAFWVQNGVCSIYAGRIMNTIQRADFCGVFGSRMVMQGAQDRVPEVVDYTKYTINRVREVSLNKKESVIPEDKTQSTAATNIYRSRKQHGNYFGIYSIVNYLGALTSDFDFGGDNDSYGDVRTTDNIDTQTYGPDPDSEGQTFYGWKANHKDDRKRNNGNSHNKVALASGVYLELTTEKSIGKDLYEKDWGLITGVIELDLINVQQGMGGGFVYAKNVHGTRTKTNRKHTTLTALNAGAVTQWDYVYVDPDYEDPEVENDSPADYQREWQTSGNFVHSTQTIVDDCYNVSHKYMGNDRVPAHYWYIKGSVYVYDQYISAYTGATNAYSETVDLPLTIAAASHGRIQLVDVKENKYAYYSNSNLDKLDPEQKLVINNVTYYLNDPIGYWDWYKLSKAEQALFVDKTYVTTDSCYINGKYHAPGEVMLPSEYDPIETAANSNKKVIEEGKPAVPAVKKATKDAQGNPIVVQDDEGNDVYEAFTAVFHESNNMSHNTGYILTYTVNNPKKWDTWYTPIEGGTKITNEVYTTDENIIKTDYEDGPTYQLKNYGTGEGTFLGQRDYKVSDIISEKVESTYQTAKSIQGCVVPGNQAVFDRAFISTESIQIRRTLEDDTEPTMVTLTSGLLLSETEGRKGGFITKNSQNEPVYTSVAPAFVSTKTIPLSDTQNIYINSYMTEDEKDDYIDGVTEDIQKIITTITEPQLDNVKTINDLSKYGIDVTTLTALERKELSDLILRRADMRNCIVPAYYCTKSGKYGGNYYLGGTNYRGLEAWSSMSAEDRENFVFNYDAFDLLIDPYYSINPETGNLGYAEKAKYQYDGPEYTSEADVKNSTTGNPAEYSLEQPIDYIAIYQGTSTTTLTKEGGATIDVSPGDELPSSVFESLINEQRHYTSLTVTENDLKDKNGNHCDYTFYVAREPLLVGSTPYAAGATITKEEYDILLAKADDVSTDVPVDVLTYRSPITQYYCREEYTPAGSETPVRVGTIINSGTLNSGDYGNLPNDQKNFLIQGIAPTETSTLYVSLNSNIDDLSKEKIITVIYEYNYEESDLLGNHITPVCERHVVNIHIEFKTGAPTVADIEAPQIILPGELVKLFPPEVIDGAAPTQGGGWELYKTEKDADNHNGIPFTPNLDPLYWYQDGYWLRYYALSYVGGKTYSNKVQVSVANYHDLKKVMEDKQHHYYVDIPDLNRLRESKIYINDADNGAQQLKDLFELSLLTSTSTGVTDDVVTADGRLKGHSLLDPQVAACDNLEIIMRTNVKHTGTWDPIGGDGKPCFAGNLHGDGHYFSGLDHSLFDKLCGNVYNLGVMGSFTGAGIAETGSGYVENCWISTNSTKKKTSYPVFGNPTEINDSRPYRIVNCYYQEEDDAATTAASDDANKTVAYDNHTDATTDYGKPTRKPKKAFYNGEVAYDLNGFYLLKRYADGSKQTDGLDYRYFKVDDLNKTLETKAPTTAYYGTANASLSSSGVSGVYGYHGYVEDRYADGDFRYAGGEIPTGVDERLYIDKTDQGKTKFAPIWPDDYIFFGQMLTYGWNNPRPHEDVPSSIVKNSGRLTSSDLSNRVYRAPAYYRNSTMSVAHFNPAVNLVAYSKPENQSTEALNRVKAAYPGMTAIDFEGHNDLSKGYQQGLKGVNASGNFVEPTTTTAISTRFYPPLLDDDGLISIVNRDETPNLLVYAPAATAPSEGAYANEKTYTALTKYFTEPKFSDYYNKYYNEGSEQYENMNSLYRCVAVAPTESVFGHLVQQNLIAPNDHLLVDKKDFNCPIPYDMGAGYRMWYQRLPKNYVEPVWDGSIRTTKGWESVSLPFTAELVTTVKKGEITHFYNGSYGYHDRVNGFMPDGTGDDSKVGHEYWLRKYRDISQLTGEPTADEKALALFTYPGVTDDPNDDPFKKDKEETMTKVMKNSFLWDYYYNNANASTGNHHLDANLDEYQTYYKPGADDVVNTFNDYALLTKAIPYLIGFPGKSYYEFDLSGNFFANTTAASHPAKLLEQTITFASNTGVTIGVSDLEQEGVTYTITKNNVRTNFTFKPNYLNEVLAAGSDNYALSDDGSSFDKVLTAKDTEVAAFRPYFSSAVVTGARNVTRTILFSNDDSQLKGVEEKGDPNSEDPGTLSIRAEKHKIVVESALTRDVDIRIVNAAGITVTTFNIEPGETIETRINNAGVYIVQSADGRYIKKLAVK